MPRLRGPPAHFLGHVSQPRTGGQLRLGGSLTQAKPRPAHLHREAHQASQGLVQDTAHQQAATASLLRLALSSSHT